MINRQLSIQSERTIPLGAIKYVGTSTLKDDWFSLGVGSPQEPDPLINCVFKIEFFTHLKIAMPGGLNLKIAESYVQWYHNSRSVQLTLSRIEYNKKPGKPTVIKVIKDAKVPRDDLYKSGTIYTGPGEPPNSRSRPTPRPKQIVGRPITKGKLLRPGGPGGAPSKLASRPAASRPIQQPIAQSSPQPRVTTHARPVPQAHTSTSRAVPQPLAAINGISHGRSESSSSADRPLPPPPPAAPPAARKETYSALYDFEGQSQNELTMKKDDIVEVVQKEGNGNISLSRPLRSQKLADCSLGWWLAKKLDGSSQGWAPSAYLKEETQRPAPPPAPPVIRQVPPPPSMANGVVANGALRPGVKAKPTPPAPPAKRPTTTGRKPLAPPAPRDSAVSMTSTDGSGSGRDTPNSSSNVSLAGGLAEALRQRQMAMQGKKTDENEW